MLQAALAESAVVGQDDRRIESDTGAFDGELQHHVAHAPGRGDFGAFARYVDDVRLDRDVIAFVARHDRKSSDRLVCLDSTTRPADSHVDAVGQDGPERPGACSTARRRL